MRIKTIHLSWFRGASDHIALEPKCKSMVVYGSNASGKSSFVDAIEYVLNDGKITHLAHEYSGRRLEKAVPNTHKPHDKRTRIGIEFEDNSDLKIEIKDDGSADSSGTKMADVWNYRRMVLRQEEVSAFIGCTKGDKYSALLPLLGLYEMEVAAENLRQVSKVIESKSKLKETRDIVKQVDTKRRAIFGEDSDDAILEKIKHLHLKYCAENVDPKDGLLRCVNLTTSIDARIERLSADQKQHFTLQAVAKSDLRGHVDIVREALLKLANVTESLITERLTVLQAAETFVGKLTDETEVKCPACGQTISVHVFQEHVEAELKRLQGIVSIFDELKKARGTLRDTVRSIKTYLGNADVKTWRDELSKGALAKCFVCLEDINAEQLRTFCSEKELKKIEDDLLPLVSAAISATVQTPPDVKQLSTDRQIVETAKDTIDVKEQSAIVARAETLIALTTLLEDTVREEIKLRAKEVVAEISEDIRAMWMILHPGEAIENVRLQLPENPDKAIDIGLKFYGKELTSPRLTLSEGYRNSLGLCIFLAMAKRGGDGDHPIFLDDVVISLDREHRGMIVKLLEKMFGKRQVIILTHDRVWYTELRQQLDARSWIFKTLLPYETPEIGIRWSDKSTTFDDARAHLHERSDFAGNDARKIMDVELALIAEHLQIRLPYLRFDKNDRRMAHDFLERLVADGKKCFQKRMDKDYVIHEDAIEALNTADKLLTSWANRASHTFDLVFSEATNLINACEKALEYFKCADCGKNIWFATSEASACVQCQCGGLRWRYGKG